MAATTYSLKGALLNRMRAELARSALCPEGRQQLRWWLRQGRAYPTITAAVHAWAADLDRVNGLLRWLGLRAIASPTYPSLEKIQRAIQDEWTDIPTAQEASLCREIAAAYERVFGPPQTANARVRATILDDHYFDRALRRWDWSIAERTVTHGTRRRPRR